jgi:hypothetical protein
MSVPNTPCRTHSTRASRRASSPEPVSCLDTKLELQVSTIQASSYAETLQNVPTLQEWINSVLDAMPRLPLDPENVGEEQQERYQVRENLGDLSGQPL